VVFRTVGDGSGEIERCGAFGADNRKPSRPGSVSVWSVQVAMGFVKEVHGQGQVRSLRSRAHVIAEELDGDTWVDEINHLIKKN